MTIASRELDVALDILADAVQHSRFDPDELAKEIEVVIEELNRGQDQPSRVASEMLFAEMYPTHPYGRPVIGTLQSVRSMTRERILEFYRRWYRPGHMTLVVAGDVDPEYVEGKVRGLFAGGEPPLERPLRPKEAPLQAPRVRLKRKSIQETHLFLGWPTVELSHPDTPLLDLLSVILGAGESSRLYRRVKRELERVNDCFAFSHTPEDPGMLAVGGQVHGPGVLDALDSLLETTLRVLDHVGEEELTKAKTIITSEQVYLRETVDGMARRMGYFASTVGDVNFEAAYYRAIENARPEDVLGVARRILGGPPVVTALMPDGVPDDVTEAAVLDLIQRRRREHEVVDAPPPPPGVQVEPAREGFVRAVLSNGARVVIQEDRTVPRVSIRAAAIGGLLGEDRARNGVGHLTSQLLARGTKDHSAEELVEACDAMAAGLGGISGRSSLGLSGDFLSASWPRGFQMFMSCLLEPTFEEEELRRERRTALEDIEARQDSPTTMVFDRLAEALHGSHPYAMPVIGTAESVGSLTRDDVVSTWRRQLAPDRTVVAVVGAVDPRATLERLEATLGQAPTAPAWELPPPSAPPPGAEIEVSMEREQAHVAMGFAGVALSDPRRLALDLLSTVLGGQSGRLFLDLRDTQSLAYAVSAMHLDGYHPGSFAAYIGTHPSKLSTAESGLMGHLRAVVADGITEAELARAQRYLVGAHEIGLQRASARASTMALMEVYGEGYDAHLRYPDRLLKLTVADVHAAARDILQLDRPVTVRLRPKQPSTRTPAA